VRAFRAPRVAEAEWLKAHQRASGARLDLKKVACAFKALEMEGWPSGLRRTLGKRVYGKPYRGFESHPLRHDSESASSRTRQMAASQAAGALILASFKNLDQLHARQRVDLTSIMRPARIRMQRSRRRHRELAVQWVRQAGIAATGRAHSADEPRGHLSTGNACGPIGA
jgi:hypothetical protein